MNRLAILVGLALATGAARADKPKKQELLEEKQARAVDPAAKTKWDKQLAKLVGKPPPPIVNVRNTWTDETLVLDARPDATISQATLNRFLRCHFTNQSTEVDSRLVKVLVGAALHFKANTIFIVSGFRAPKYNLMLRKKGHEVARNSQHSEGNAVDFRLPGVPVRQLQRYVKSLHLGGVGIYLQSQFVHADTGPVRYWSGR